MLKNIDKSASRLRGSSKGTTVKRTLPENITKKESHIAQTVANNPKIVEEGKKNASDSIPIFITTITGPD